MQARRLRPLYITVFTCLFLANVITPALLCADQNDYSTRARFNSVKGSSAGSRSTISLPPISFEDGGELTIVSSTSWVGVSEIVRDTVLSTHARLGSYFGELPPVKTIIRLMDEDVFFLTTGAPRWTNALYIKDQIIIPLPPHTDLDVANLERSIKHEYTHAVIHGLSNGQCPGWLDEGLAQWMEGPMNPLLMKAFNRWLKDHKPLPLSMLQNGFTQLNPSMVPAAYAQSLFSAQHLIKNQGFEKIRAFLTGLKDSSSQSSSFDGAFSFAIKDFEKAMHEDLAASGY